MKYGDILLNNVPDHGIFHNVITVNQNITKTDNTPGLTDLICRCRVNSIQAVQGLSYNFKLPLNAGAQQGLVFIISRS